MYFPVWIKWIAFFIVIFTSLILPYSEKEDSKKIIGKIKEVKITMKKAIHLIQTGKYIYLF
jgi:hypothetical protein